MCPLFCPGPAIDPLDSFPDNREMNKILLVYEEYADLMSAENTLKRVGFDVIGLSSEYSVAEQIVAFNPDLVVGSGRGGKVTSLGVGKRLKEMLRWQGRSVLIFPANFKPGAQDLIKIRADLILEAPVPPVRLLQVIAKLLGQDEAVLLEKLNKSMHVENAQKAATGGVFGSKFSTEDEPIVVRGSTDKKSDQNIEGFSESGNTPEFENPEENLKKTESLRPFKFGDKLTQADIEQGVSANSEEAFPDVDLGALERELTGGGGEPEIEAASAQETESPQKGSSEEMLSDGEMAAGNDEDLSVSGGADSDADVSQQVGSGAMSEEIPKSPSSVTEELRKAEVKLKEKIAKYSEMVENVKITPKSTLSRVDARRAWRSVVEEQDENTKDIDELRREFVQAMFKK